jgi:hypothetical protein
VGNNPDLPPGRVAFPSMGYLVWHLSLRWQAQLSDELEPLGITPAQYAVLAHPVRPVTSGHPVLIHQRDHARDHNQPDRAALFDNLLDRLSGDSA